jgi:hypothetical protein
MVKEAMVVKVVVDVMHEGHPHHADCDVSLNTNILVIVLSRVLT